MKIKQLKLELKNSLLQEEINMIEYPEEAEFMKDIIIRQKVDYDHNYIRNSIIVKVDEWLYKISLQWDVDHKWRFAWEGYHELNIVKVEEGEQVIKIYNPVEETEDIEIYN